ncbi:MAG: phosphate ABC transporter permease subunit PstC, partial [Pleurocapsa sp.]
MRKLLIAKIAANLLIFSLFLFRLREPIPSKRNFIPGMQPFNSLSAGIVLGIAIIPTVASLSEDAIYAVP